MLTMEGLGMFKNAIVKTPGKSYVEGLTTAGLGKPDYEKVLAQHKEYVAALEHHGVSVTCLPASEEFPDSTFVEDTAVLTKEFAVITNPGTPSRNGEVKEMEKVLKDFYKTFYYIHPPGTLEGGDVLQVDKHFYIGLSKRTNEEGARQLIRILKNHGYTGSVVPVNDYLHLKTGTSYVQKGVMLVAGEFAKHEGFEKHKQIIVPKKEEYAANCIMVNEYVMMPKGYPDTKRKIKEAGCQVVEVEASEFRKQDGGLSCLSLRF